MAAEWGIIMNYLIVVDMQNDFIDGVLGTPEAEAIADRVAAKAESFDGTVIFTRDTHGEDYLCTQEGKKLPVRHCIKPEHGWQICPALEKSSQNALIFDKPAFASRRMAEYIADRADAESITLVGLCTDICVISNAMLLKAFLPEALVRVDSSCCAGVTPESHLRALEAMKMCQIEIV